MKKKTKKRKHIFRGGRLFYDDEGRMFVKTGNSRVYLNSATVRKIEGRKNMEKPKKKEKVISKESFIFHKKTI